MSDRMHITRRGYERVLVELKQLKGIDRHAVVEEIARAREHGDLSENAEYDAAKEKQGMIEARIRQLEDLAARAEIVEPLEGEPDRVRFGTTVRLEDLESGDEIQYTIVGEYEADASQGLLSVTSPVARALIGKSVEDTAQVKVPAGTREFEILEISFES